MRPEDQVFAQVIDHNLVCLDLPMAQVEKLGQDDIEAYDDMASCLFPSTKCKSREYWYSSGAKILLIHVKGGTEPELIRLNSDIESLSGRKEIDMYKTILISVGYMQQSVLVTFRDVCCVSYTPWKTPRLGEEEDPLSGAAYK